MLYCYCIIVSEIHDLIGRPCTFSLSSILKGIERRKSTLFHHKPFFVLLFAGRGALNLATYQALPTEPLELPALCLALMISERNNATVNFDDSAAAALHPGATAQDFSGWPDFHNGVAAGLKLAAGGQLARTWFLYNSPTSPSYVHGGMLLGLGLRGVFLYAIEVVQSLLALRKLARQLAEWSCCCRLFGLPCHDGRLPISKPRARPHCRWRFAWNECCKTVGLNMRLPKKTET